MIGIPLGLLYANAMEWGLHQFLHKAGKSKRNFFNFHWREHHKNCRTNENNDPEYHNPMLQWHHPVKELISLSGLALIHAPFVFVAPFFTATAMYGGLNYYFKHKKSHMDVEWGKKHMPWHYDHHMGPDQNKNWCITKPWFDNLMGTREEYLGTKREKADNIRKTLRIKRKNAVMPKKTPAFVEVSIKQPQIVA